MFFEHIHRHREGRGRSDVPRTVGEQAGANEHGLANENLKCLAFVRIETGPPPRTSIDWLRNIYEDFTDRR